MFIEDGNGDAYAGGDAIIQALQTPHGHQGLWFDPETGLYYIRARYYNPRHGRWLQRDPNETGLVMSNILLHSAQTPMASLSVSAEEQYSDGMHVYAFTVANPLLRGDPSGLAVQPFTSVHDWYTELGSAKRAINRAYAVQEQLWEIDWGTDDYGDAIYDLIVNRDYAVDTLAFAFNKIVQGKHKRTQYAIGATYWLFEWMMTMAPDVQACVALPLAIGRAASRSAFTQLSFASERSASTRFVPVNKVRQQGGIHPIRLGRIGQSATYIQKNTRRIPSLTGTKRYRIPDGLTDKYLIEVKNVSKLDFTRQLQDYLFYSMMKRKTMVLVVRRTTKLSRPLVDVIEAGYIKVAYLP